MRVALLLILSSTLLGCGQVSDCDSLLSSIRVEFQRTNPKIADIQILDAKPKSTDYWVVARGIIASGRFEDSFENELFGVFVADESFVCITDVVDVFPTPSWRDYELWIEAYDLERVTVQGRGATYHNHLVQKSYLVEPES